MWLLAILLSTAPTDSIEAGDVAPEPAVSPADSAVEPSAGAVDPAAGEAAPVPVDSGDLEVLSGATDIEDVSMEDLLNLPIVTASKRSERVSDSPAIVSLITREDVRSFGGLTLEERLSYLAGVELIETYYGYTSMTFRGITQTHYNNKSLFLINGHPLFVPTTGTYFFAQLPKLAIQQVEVVRGPGSTLHGTNAYAGVINAITRRPDPAKGGDFYEAEILAGSFFRNEVHLAAGKRFGDVDLYLFGSHSDSNGYPFIVAMDEEGRSGEPETGEDFFGYEDDRDAVYGGFTWGNLTANAGYFRQKKDKFGIIPTLVSTGPRYIDGWLADVTYRLNITDDHSLTFTGRTDGYVKEELLGRYLPVSFAPGQPVKQHWLGYKTGGEIQYSGTFLDKTLAITAGVALDHYQTDLYTFNYTEDVFDAGTGELISPAGSVWESASAILEPHAVIDVSTYANVDFTLWHKLKLAGGVRVNINSDYGAFVAPRGGVVFSATDELTLKALYGRAYRAPSFFEKFVSTTDVLYGGDWAYTAAGERVDTPLQPELIDSFDLAIEWRYQRYMLRLTGFFLIMEDEIGRGRTVAANSSLGNSKDTPAYSNGTSTMMMAGGELDAEIRPIPTLRLFGNLTYRGGISRASDPVSGEVTETELPHYFAPFLANLGGTYRFAGVASVSLYGQVIGARAMTTGAEEEVSFDPYILLNMQVTYQPWEAIEIALIAKNLLNQSYAYPEYIRRKVAEVPGGPGTEIFGRVRATF